MSPPDRQRGQQLRAVLLDLDGTLVDSHPALVGAYRRFVEAHGGVPSDEEYARWNGPPLGEIVRGLTATHHIAGDERTLYEEYVALLEGSYLTDARLMPGAEALLEALATAKIARALVTSAPARLAHRMLKARGVTRWFDTVVCGDEIPHGKPAPDGYQEALRRLGVSPEEAIACEDTPTGVRAACAAGLRCIAAIVGAPTHEPAPAPEPLQGQPAPAHETLQRQPAPAHETLQRQPHGEHREPIPLPLGEVDARSAAGEGAPLLLAGALVTITHLDELRDLALCLHRGAPGRVIRASEIQVIADGPAAPLDAVTTSAVDAAWLQALVARPSLTDGEIVTLGAPLPHGPPTHTPGDPALHLRVSRTRYRRFVAQRAGVPLGLRPLGVTAITVLHEPGQPPQLVLGQRSPRVTQYPGCWELVPSGGISAERVGDAGIVDVAGQLLEELDEELGVARAEVRRLAPLGLLEDLGDRVVDVAFVLEVDGARSSLEAHVAAHGEYTAIQLVALHAIRGATAEAGSESGGVGRLLRALAGEARLVPTVVPLVELLLHEQRSDERR